MTDLPDIEQLQRVVQEFRTANENLLQEISKADPKFGADPITAIAFRLDAFGLKLDTLARMILDETSYVAFEASFEKRMNAELLKLRTKVTQASLTNGVTSSGLFVAKKDW